MDLMEVIKERRSVRQFLDEAVPDSDIKEILEAARWAPSGHNKQMWKFVVVKNKEVLQKMAESVKENMEEFAEKSGLEKLKGMVNYATFFKNAPVTIAVFMEPYVSPVDEVLESLGYSPLEIQRLRGQADLQSIGAAIQNLLLAAHAKGYGTCWMCAPNVASREIEELLGVKEPWVLKALIPLGKPARTPRPTPRKELDEIMKIIY